MKAARMRKRKSVLGYEPYAPMSARTGLCGGRRAAGIPIATGFKMNRYISAAQDSLLEVY